MFLLKLIADQLLVFDWIAGSCQVNLLKKGQDCSDVRKSVNANSGLKVTKLKLFFYTNVFCCFVLCVYHLNSKQEAKQYTENLTANSQNFYLFLS